MTSIDNETLVNLVDGCVQKSRKAQEMLYKSYFGYALSVALLYSSRHDDALDTVNDSFIKIFMQIGRFDPNFSVSARADAGKIGEEGDCENGVNSGYSGNGVNSVSGRNSGNCGNGRSSGNSENGGNGENVVNGRNSGNSGNGENVVNGGNSVNVRNCESSESSESGENCVRSRNNWNEGNVRNVENGGNSENSVNGQNSVNGEKNGDGRERYVVENGGVQMGSGSLQRRFLGWVRRIVINTAIDKLRREKIFKRDSEDIELAERAYKWAGNGAEIIHSELNAKEILMLLNYLPGKHKAVFCLYDIEGYTHEEIAKMLSIPESSSRVYLTRARAKLRELYGKNFNG